MVSSEEVQLNLFARHEAYVLAQGQQSRQDVPACVVSGFLGSGKTTLVSHLLRNRGGLRLAVLINEVGEVDVDSQLVGSKTLHAETGTLPILHTHPHDANQHQEQAQRTQQASSGLAGGCICCSAAGGLEVALARLQQLASGAPGVAAGIDYLVVETSGVADPEPLAAILARHGFQLESVVVVVDAEAGPATLLQQPVAQAQVRCADVVVVNKCDVASLGSAADVEDACHHLAPGVRMLRARYGQVPLHTLLDVELEPEPPLSDQQQQPEASVQAAQQQAVKGEVGFLSHEAAFTTSSTNHTGPRYRPAGRLSKAARAQQAQLSQHAQHASSGEDTHHNTQDAAQPQQGLGHGDQHHGHPQHHHKHQHGPHSHASLHAGYHTVSVVLEHCGPISLAAFQLFAAALTRLPGLYRAKGLLWLRQLRSHRTIFHLSGRQRVECVVGEVWASPPATQLVMIGSDPQLLEQLRSTFLRLGAREAGGSVRQPAALAAATDQLPPTLPASPTSLPAVETSASTTTAAATAAAQPQEQGGLQQQDQQLLLQHQCTQLLARQLSTVHERLKCNLVVAGHTGHTSHTGQHPAHHTIGVSGNDPHSSQAIAALPQLDIAADAGPAASGAAAAAGQHASMQPLLLELRVQGEPLHGVRGAEVNAAVMRRAANGLGRMGHLVLGVPDAVSISAISGLATGGDRMERLLVVPDPCSPLLGAAATNNAFSAAASSFQAAAGADGNGASTTSAPTSSSSSAAAAGACSSASCVDQSEAVFVREVMSMLQQQDSLQGIETATLAQSKATSSQPTVQPPAEHSEAQRQRQQQQIVVAACDKLFAWLGAQCAAPALRQAFPHAGCQCDVVAAMHATST